MMSGLQSIPVLTLHRVMPLESNFAPGRFGGWADLSASPWLYNLFKQERTTAGKLDPRLYWTIGTYENDWEGFENGNVSLYQ